MGYTKGPWRVAAVSHNDKMARVGSNTDASAEEIKNGGMWVSQCIGPDRDANARLIAAAPDLLEVAQDISAWEIKYPADRIYDMGQTREIAGEMTAIVERARAAIAKAAP